MRKTKLLLTTLAITAAMNLTAFAGEWKQDSVGWWYQNDDGSYPANGWQWIDGDNNGISECYYFNESGYCLMNTMTPDGQKVDANGALTTNGVVETQTVQQQTVQEQTVTTQNSQTETPSNPITDMVWISGSGKKYHSSASCSNMKNPTQVSLEDAQSQGRTACSKCY